jgi:hypothetical protein
MSLYPVVLPDFTRFPRIGEWPARMADRLRLASGGTGN